MAMLSGHGVAVPQLYVRDRLASVVRPVRELKAFGRVPLDAGECAQMRITVPVDMLCLTDHSGERVVEPGWFDLMLGGSSADTPLRGAAARARAIEWLGKVGIPDAVLKKPGSFNPEERAVMNEHPRIGAEILGRSRIPLFQLAAEVALSHHERWDGAGYPAGLAGEAIPLAARLMAVADVYDALISKRVYKPAFSHDQACNTIIRGKGTHFDPDMVDAFVDIAEDFRSIAQKYPDPG